MGDVRPGHIARSVKLFNRNGRRRGAGRQQPDQVAPEKKGAQRPDPASLRRLLRLAAPYWKQLVIAGILLGISTVLTLTMPLFVQGIVNSVVTDQNWQMMTTLSLGLVVVFLVQSVFNFGQSYLLAYTGERLVADLRKRVFGHLQSLSLSFYDNQRVGELTSRLSNDVAVVQAGLTNNLLGPFSQALTLVGALTMIIIIDWHLILLVLCIVPPVVLIGAVFGRRLGKLSEKAQSALGVATTVLEETLAAPRIVKAFGREGYEIERYGELGGAIVPGGHEPGDIPGLLCCAHDVRRFRRAGRHPVVRRQRSPERQVVAR